MARARSTTLMTPRARTARPVARQATQAVTAAEDFAAPAGAGKEAVVKRWWQPQAALAVQASGGALRVVGIRKKAGQPAYFLRLARAGDAPNAQAINADEADLRDAGQCSQIIMGFVGGFFRTSRGIRVRVVDTAGSGQYVERVHVEAFAGEAGSASLGTTTHALQGFLQDITLAPWDEAAAAAAAGGTGTAAFMGQYPGLQEVLQVAFGDPLPEQGALEEAMSAMAEGQPDGGGSFAERAAALEAQVHTPEGRPASRACVTCRPPTSCPRRSRQASWVWLSVTSCLTHQGLRQQGQPHLPQQLQHLPRVSRAVTRPRIRTTPMTPNQNSRTSRRSRSRPRRSREQSAERVVQQHALWCSMLPVER